MLLEHAEFVRIMASALMRNEHDADDLAQETYAAALERGPTRAGPIRPWLVGVLRRRAADKRRKDARRLKREERAARSEATDAATTVAARTEIGRRVVDAVMALSEPMRTAVLLRHYDGYPPRKIAALTGVPVETVRTRVRRGLALIRADLDARPGMDRRSVGMALALLEKPGAASTLPTLLGVAVVKKVILAACLLVGALAVWNVLPESAHTPAPTRDARGMEEPTLEGIGPGAPLRASNTGLASIEGTVDEGGVPTTATVSVRRLPDNATVSLEPCWLYEDVVSTNAAAASVQSDATGTFRFDEVEPGRYELRAVKDGRLGTTTILVPRGRAHLTARLSILGGEILLQGTAVHADGRPFRGFVRVHGAPGLTAVRTMVGDHHEFGHGLFATDATGAFIVRGVPRGEVVLAALIPGKARYISAPVTLPHQGPYRFVVDDGAEIIEGRVVHAEDGAAIRGAEVTVSAAGLGGHRNHVVATSDASGAFRVAIQGSDVGLHVRATGFAEAHVGSTSTEPITTRFVGTYTATGPRRPRSLGPLVSPLTIRLLRAASVHGLVRSESGPVAGVEVLAAAVGDRDRGAWHRTTTDAQGRYRLTGLHPGEVILVAAGAGWLSRDLESLRAHTGAHGFVVALEPGAIVERDLHVVASGRIRGRVVHTDGSPAVGCLVAPSPAATPFPLQRLKAPPWLGRGVTDENGSFVLDPLLPGHAYQLYAVSGRNPVTRTEAVFVSDAETDPVKITIDEPHWIDVRVVDDVTGAPIPHVTVSLGGVRSRPIWEQWSTDETGVARAGPLPRRDHYTAWVKARGYLNPRHPVAVSPRAGTGDRLVAEVRLTPGGTIRGVVVSPENVAREQIAVELIVPRALRRLQRAPKYTRVDAAGHFVFEGLARGTYTVRALVRGDGHALTAEAQAAPDEEPLRLVLEDDGGGTRWRIAVVGADGQHVSDGRARFHWRQPGGGVGRETVDLRHGHAAFRLSIDTDEAWVSVFRCADTSGRTGTLGTVMHHPLPLEGGDVPVTLPRPRELAGRVVCDGRGVEGVVLSVVPAPEGATTGASLAHGYARTDSDGAYRMEGMGEGPYHLHVQTTADFRRVEPIVLTAGQERADVTLERGVGPRIVVLDPTGRPASGVRLALRAPGEPYADPVTGRLRSTGPTDLVTGRDGKVRFRELSAGERYDLHVVPGDQAWASEVLAGWTPQDTTIRLHEALRITGRVVDHDGSEPSRRANLWHRRHGHAWERGRVAKDSTFAIGGLRDGEEVAIFASHGVMHASPDAGPLATFRAGARDVVVRARPALTQTIRVIGWNPDWKTVMMTAVPRGIDHGLVGVVEPSGLAKLYSLEAGRDYALHIGPTPDGRYGWVESFTSGKDTLEVELQRGEQIQGIVLPPPGGEVRSAYLRRAGVAVSVQLDEHGAFTAQGLRPGTWTLHAYGKVGRKPVLAEREVATGGSVTVQLPPSR